MFSVCTAGEREVFRLSDGPETRAGQVPGTRVNLGLTLANYQPRFVLVDEASGQSAAASTPCLRALIQEDKQSRALHEEEED